MREIVEHYVRSLPERDDSSSVAQDLNALIVWLLQHRGFTVELYPYHYRNDGNTRENARGERQFGVDILASKSIDGCRTLYRFVLKRGSPRDDDFLDLQRGSLPSDINKAAARAKHEDEALTGEDESNSRIVVAGVFNGRFDREVIGNRINNFESHFETRFSDLKLEWWDIERITDMIIAISESSSDIEPTIFAPEIRPFFRMTLDSLRRDSVQIGEKLDFGSLTNLLEQEERSIKRKTGSCGLRQDYVAQGLSELAFFSFMLERECRRHVEGNVLPVLVTLERTLVLAGRLLQQTDSTGQGTKRDVTTALELLLNRYLEIAGELAEKLESIADTEYGLAIDSLSERVDYPIRLFRLGAHLATAALVAQDLGRPKESENHIEVLAQIIESNPPFGHPIAEDQVVELVVILDALFSEQRHDSVEDLVWAILNRYIERLRIGQPLPISDVRINQPMPTDWRQRLVDVYFDQSPIDEIPENQSGTLILPITLYTACGLDREETEHAFDTIMEYSQERGGVFPQVWLPPQDASSRWYREYLGHDGVGRILQTTEGISQLIADFESSTEDIQPSEMQSRGFPSVDRMAWKLHRNLPSVDLIIDWIAQAKQDTTVS